MTNQREFACHSKTHLLNGEVTAAGDKVYILCGEKMCKWLLKDPSNAPFTTS